MSLPALNRWRNWIPRLPSFQEGIGSVSSAASLAFSAGTELRVFDQWALVYMVAGKGFYRDTKMEQTVLPGTWILIIPGVAHSYGPLPGEKWHEVYITFRGPIFELWHEYGYFSSTRPIGNWLPPAKGVPRLREFFKQTERSNCTGLQAICLFQNLLSEIFNHHQNPSLHYPAWLTRACSILEKGTNQSIAQIATVCGMGYESFRKKFEHYMGVPPAHYAMKQKIEQARHLMAMRQLTNKEISELLGFYDEFHFSKTFSRLTGQTPRQFRIACKQTQTQTADTG